jgi:S-adenosylmethionine uptake transporter
MQALWILAAGLCFSVMGAFVKTGAQYFTTSELVFYRSLVSALVMVAMMTYRGVDLRTKRLGMHARRGVFGLSLS